MKNKLWKQSDPDYSPTLVVDENNHYVSTACSSTAAILFISQHNDEVKKSVIAGMELAMRICRNRAQDYGGDLSEPRCQAAETCAGMIRMVQVEIGAGRMPLPEFTIEEQEEIDRIA